MKKKLINHAKEIRCEKFPELITDGEANFAVDLHRILRLETLPEELPFKLTDVSSCLRYMNIMNERDYVIYELPEKTEIKDAIRNLVGRKFDRVVWINKNFGVNARYLYKAMEALNATVCYIDKMNPRRRPIFLFENDNLQSFNMEIVLPVLTSAGNNKVGYFIL